MADTLAYLGTLPKFNGRAAAMGFCYGGPYAISAEAPRLRRRHSCHGTQMLDYIQELDGCEPVCIVWGDQDHRRRRGADAYRGIVAHEEREVHIFPGALHGYMMRGSPRRSIR